VVTAPTAEELALKAALELVSVCVVCGRLGACAGTHPCHQVLVAAVQRQSDAQTQASRQADTRTRAHAHTRTHTHTHTATQVRYDEEEAAEVDGTSLVVTDLPPAEPDRCVCVCWSANRVTRLATRRRCIGCAPAGRLHDTPPLART
jgi:hypothetical protein